MDLCQQSVNHNHSITTVKPLRFGYVETQKKTFLGLGTTSTWLGLVKRSRFGLILIFFFNSFIDPHGEIVAQLHIDDVASQCLVQGQLDMLPRETRK